MKKNNNVFKCKADYFMYILLALYPIMSIYELFPLLSMGYFILLLIIIRNIIEQKFIIKCNFKIFYTMSMLMIINLVIGLIKYTDVSNTINNTVSMAIFTFLACFLCLSNYFSLEKLYKACKLIALISTVFLFYQVIAYNFFGIIAKGNISFLNSIQVGFESINYGRPNSFFLEPAHYAIYIAPVFATSLVKKEFFFSSILLTGLVLSTSSSGIMLGLIIPFMVFLRGNKRKIINTLKIIFAGSTILFVVLSNVDTSFFQKFSIDGLMSNIRVFGTLHYFKLFSLTEIIFGIGINRLSEFLAYNGYVMAHNYANAYFFSIFSFGIIGGCIWITYIISLYKNIMPNYKCIFYIFILICLGDQILFNRNLLYLLIWVYVVSYPKKSLKVYGNKHDMQNNMSN